ncbi:hypothetical protein GMJAKD_12185 [Candidatus Electrothrix aarhusensis]
MKGGLIESTMARTSLVQGWIATVHTSLVQGWIVPDCFWRGCGIVAE